MLKLSERSVFEAGSCWLRWLPWHCRSGFQSLMTIRLLCQVAGKEADQQNDENGLYLRPHRMTMIHCNPPELLLCPGHPVLHRVVLPVSRRLLLAHPWE